MLKKAQYGGTEKSQREKDTWREGRGQRLGGEEEKREEGRESRGGRDRKEKRERKGKERETGGPLMAEGAPHLLDVSFLAIFR